ncbi:MAG: stage V sporulation protein AD [Lachnospira sp.]
MQKGRQSICFNENVYISCGATIVGKKESEGPLGKCFDVAVEDDMCGKNNWEEAESEFQHMAVDKLFMKSGLSSKDIRYIFGGDLLSQLIATSYGLSEYELPLFGLYGACSTMGEAISLAAMSVNAGYADNVIALSSSHFASAEKQFRFPLEYGNQRPEASTWTVCGCGAYVVSKNEVNSGKKNILIKGITTGKIVDYGVKDSMNMGACMAPAAADLIEMNFKDFEIDESYYDCIVTGDLGYTGQKILFDLLKEKNIDIASVHTDCGIEIFDRETQSTKSGGSGCGCSAVTLNALILPKLRSGEYKRVLFVPTGALLSTVSYNEGRSVPGIAHGVVLEAQ